MKHLFVLGAVCLVLTGCTNLGGDAMIESDLVYADRPSGELSGHLFRPQGDGPHPAVVVIHGGGWRGGEPWHMGHVSRRLANDGFVVFTPTYRFTPEHVHPAQLNDVRDAYRWLAAQSFVDRANIAVWGYSAGAHLTLMLGLAPESAGGLGDGERPIALIGGGSPTDFNLFSADEALIVQLIGRERGDDPEAWEAASPISWVTGDDPPVYLYHGSLDRVVDIDHARALNSALQEAGVPSILDTVMGGHISVAVLDRNVEGRALAWLRQHLSDATGTFDMLPADAEAP